MAIPSTFCISLFLLLNFFPFSVTSYSNISSGSSLTTSSKDPWRSPSGDFAFGFQQISPTNNNFLLAIVFDKIPERTVVWSANRNTPVPGGSTVQLTSDGRLVLSDPSGREVWTAYGAASSYAAMLDTGNFVLTSENFSIVWESFDVPTDTLLPDQILDRGSRLIARYSSTNYSEGRFKFTLQDDGNLVQYTTTYPQMGNNLAYWATMTDAGNKLVFNQTGFVYLITSNGSVIRNVLGNGVSTQELYHRLTLDYDGVLRYYVYPKWARRWNTLQFQPSDVCKLNAKIGSGACGFNSYCELEGAENPVCKCPPGFVFLDSNDVYRGCVQNFAPQDCRLQQNEKDAFDLAVMHKANFADGDYEFLVSYTEDMCREACLSDCRCAVAVYDGNCWKKRLPLSNGRLDAGSSNKAFFKVRRSNSNYSSSGLIPDKADKSSLTVVVTVLLATSALVILLLLSATTFLLVSRQKNNKNRGRNDSLSVNLRNFSYSELELATGTNLMSFDYKEMELATGGFKQILGSGSSGTVYKGVLNQSTNSERLVAVKVLDKMPEKKNGQNDSRLFTTEMKLISGTNHKSLVKLVGFCNEGEHCLLVYEFMSNGSLADSLFTTTRPTIDWYTRTQIAYSVARGLVYLHEECSTQIIHCDIKPQNILLDGAMTARISDFGLSKLMKPDQTKTMTAIRGTKGYLAPEWFRNVPITAKVDVHSFGIVLLELVCCRKNCMMEVENEAEMVLVDWAYECYSNGKLYKLVEKDETAMADIARVERFVKVAMWCIQEDPCLRPGMKKVALMLEGAVGVSEPPDPNSFIGAV
ncbi:G-type lectin S-receptor-like serine/threonine-protein kinase LECRK3 [Linum grandiflorum]